MTTYHELTGFQRDLLRAIAELADDRPPYGLALKEWLDERYAEPINHSRLYQNLGTLVEDGLVSKGSLDDRTNTYALTPEGRTLLQDQAKAFAQLQPDRAVTDGGARDGE